jgi:hypothetical protein
MLLFVAKCGCGLMGISPNDRVQIKNMPKTIDAHLSTLCGFCWQHIFMLQRALSYHVIPVITNAPRDLRNNESFM